MLVPAPAGFAIIRNDWASVITVTVSNPVVSSSPAASNAPSFGGGGSGYLAGYSPYIPISVIASSTLPLPDLGCISGSRFSIATGKPCPQTLLPIGTTTPSVLELGSRGNDVRALQQYLNTHGFTVSKIGAGSPGKETVIFGDATRAALIRFQEAKGIKPAVGYFGPLTRKVIESGK